MYFTLVLSTLLTAMAHIPTVYAQPPSSVLAPRVFIISMVCHHQASSSFARFESCSSMFHVDVYTADTSLLPNQMILTTSLTPKAKYGTTTFLSPALGISPPGPSLLPAFPCSIHASSALKPAPSASSPSVKAKSTLPFP